jgi:hypothetical protein
MSVQEISYKGYGELDKDRLMGLFATEYPERHDIRNPAFLDWLYARNPAGEGGFVLAVDAAGRYRGTIGVVPFRFAWGQKRILAYAAVHVLVHRDSRSENLFSRMIRVLKERNEAEHTWLFGYPNSRAVPGWKRNKMSFRPDYVLSWNRRLFDLRLRDYEIARSATRLAEIDFSWLHKWEEDLNKPVLVADEQFLVWRFLQHPTRRYICAVRVDGTAMRGYSVIANDVKPGLDIIVDAQGDKEAVDGPAGRTTRLSFTTWHSGVVPSGRLVKRIPFFATAFGTDATNPDAPWDAVSLAACDFL